MKHILMEEGVMTNGNDTSHRDQCIAELLLLKIKAHVVPTKKLPKRLTACGHKYRAVILDTLDMTVNDTTIPVILCTAKTEKVMGIPSIPADLEPDLFAEEIFKMLAYPQRSENLEVDPELEKEFDEMFPQIRDNENYFYDTAIGSQRG